MDLGIGCFSATVSPKASARKRISHVAELAKQLRASGCAANVHEFRLRHVDAHQRAIEFNVAGLMNVAAQQQRLGFVALEFCL